MELIVKDYEQPAPIEFNFEELKNELTEKVSHYEALVYTDDQIKEAKADRANLNKLKKALNDERIRREKEYMAPFSDFKAKINEIISIIDKPVAVIDAQVKAYEEKCREEKQAEIEDYFREIEYKAEWLTLNMIWSDTWLNASCSIKTVQGEIDEKIKQISLNLETLRNLPEFSFEAIEVYKSTLDINRAIQEGARLADIQKRKMEQARLEAERQAEKKAVDEEAQIPIKEPVIEQKDEARQWIFFKACLTVEEAQALRQFFVDRGISFQPIKEGGAC